MWSDWQIAEKIIYKEGSTPRGAGLFLFMAIYRKENAHGMWQCIGAKTLHQRPAGAFVISPVAAVGG